MIDTDGVAQARAVSGRSAFSDSARARPKVQHHDRDDHANIRIGECSPGVRAGVVFCWTWLLAAALTTSSQLDYHLSVRLVGFRHAVRLPDVFEAEIRRGFCLEFTSALSSSQSSGSGTSERGKPGCPKREGTKEGQIDTTGHLQQRIKVAMGASPRAIRQGRLVRLDAGFEANRDCAVATRSRPHESFGFSDASRELRPFQLPLGVRQDLEAS